MVVSTLHITLENNGTGAPPGAPPTGDHPTPVGPLSPNSPPSMPAKCVTRHPLQYPQNEKENLQNNNNNNNNNNNSDYCDMNGNGPAIGPGTGVVGVAVAGSPASSIASASATATPQRSASALRRGIQIQRSSTRLRQQQASYGVFEKGCGGL